MENYFYKDNLARQKEFILEALKMAEKHPMMLENFEDLYYSRRELSKLEIEKINQEWNQATVSVETLAEYKFLLESVESKDQDWVIKTLAHENAHGNKGESLGAIHEGYGITFIKKPNGNIQHLPSAIVDIPNTFDSETQKRIFVEIAKAPEDYEGEDNYLSDGDIHRINNS